MNTQIESLFSSAEGRYLALEEERQIIDYTRTLDARLATMRAVQAAETSIVEGCLNDIWSQHPDMQSAPPVVREKARRDMTLVLRYAALAMVRDDPKMLEERLLYWLATILNSFGLMPVVDTGYRAMGRRVEAVLRPEQGALISPYLRQVHQTLTQSPRR